MIRLLSPAPQLGIHVASQFVSGISGYHAPSAISWIATSSTCDNASPHVPFLSGMPTPREFALLALPTSEMSIRMTSGQSIIIRQSAQTAPDESTAIWKTLARAGAANFLAAARAVDTKDALEVRFERVITELCARADHRLNLTVARELLQNHPDFWAELALAEFTESFPGESQYHELYGDLSIKLGDYRHAVYSYEKALETHAASAEGEKQKSGKRRKKKRGAQPGPLELKLRTARNKRERQDKEIRAAQRERLEGFWTRIGSQDPISAQEVRDILAAVGPERFEEVARKSPSRERLARFDRLQELCLADGSTPAGHLANYFTFLGDELLSSLFEAIASDRSFKEDPDGPALIAQLVKAGEIEFVAPEVMRRIAGGSHNYPEVSSSILHELVRKPMQMAEEHIKHKRYEEARALLIRANNFSDDPHLTKLLIKIAFQQGQACMQVQDYAQAEAFFSEVLERDQTYLPAMQQLVALTAYRGAYASAISLAELFLENAVKPGRRSRTKAPLRAIASVRYLLGFSYLHQYVQTHDDHLVVKAITNLEHTTQDHPLHVVAKTSLIAAYLFADQYEAAAKAFGAFRSTHPDRLEGTLEMLSIVAEAHNNPKGIPEQLLEAIIDYCLASSGLLENEALTSRFLNFGQFLVENDFFGPAQKIFDALEQDGSEMRFSIRYSQALIASAHGNYALATRYLSELLAREELAIMVLNRNLDAPSPLWVEAFELKTLMQRDEVRRRLKRGRSLSQAMREQFREMDPLLKRAEQLYPHHPIVLNTLALIAEEKGELAQAEHFYRKALEEEPTYLFAYLGYLDMLVRRTAGKNGERNKLMAQELLRQLKAQVYTILKQSQDDPAKLSRLTMSHFFLNVMNLYHAPAARESVLEIVREILTRVDLPQVRTTFQLALRKAFSGQQAPKALQQLAFEKTLP